MKKKKNLLCFVLLISLIFTMAFGSVTVSAAPKLNRTGEILFFQSEDRTCGFQRKDHRSEKRNSSDHSEGKYEEI